MTGFLLDVNGLIALTWPAHEAHMQTQAWFNHKSRAGWATCAFTQVAFVRIITDLLFSRDAVTPQEAVKLLGANPNHPAHRFWEEELSFVLAHSALCSAAARAPAGHRCLVDRASARQKQGNLSTMDRAVLASSLEKSFVGDFVELI